MQPQLPHGCPTPPGACIRGMGVRHTHDVCVQHRALGRQREEGYAFGSAVVSPDQYLLTRTMVRSAVREPGSSAGYQPTHCGQPRAFL